MPANSPPIQPDGVAYFLLECTHKGISKSLSQALLKSIRSSSLESYKRYWKSFAFWLNSKQLGSELTPRIICEFLFDKFTEGYNSNTLNTMRSSINFFTANSLNLDDDIFIKRLFKYFYNVRPIQPKYKTFWPVSKLLEFLKTLFPLSDLNLKLLTLKTRNKE